MAEIEAPLRRIGCERGQVTLRDQALDRRPDDQLIKDVGQPFAVEPLRRRGDAEDFCLRHGVDDLAPGRRGGVVSFVRHQEVGRLNQAVEPPDQRRHARNLHRQEWRLRITGRDDAVRHADLGQRVADLADDLVTMAEDRDTLAALGHAGNDDREQHGFAGAGRRLVQHPLRAVGIGGTDPLDVLSLIRSQDHGAVFRLRYPGRRAK